MTFPFSTHTYHLRFWMAGRRRRPDEERAACVLPPPYMVESLANPRRACAGIVSRSVIDHF